MPSIGAGMSERWSAALPSAPDATMAITREGRKVYGRLEGGAFPVRFAPPARGKVVSGGTMARASSVAADEDVQRQQVVCRP